MENDIWNWVSHLTPENNPVVSWLPAISLLSQYFKELSIFKSPVKPGAIYILISNTFF